MRVEGLGLRVPGSGFRGQGSGLRFEGSGLRVEGSGVRGTSEMKAASEGVAGGAKKGTPSVATPCQVDRAGESRPLRAVHLSHHKWPGGLVN